MAGSISSVLLFIQKASKTDHMDHLAAFRQKTIAHAGLLLLIARAMCELKPEKIILFGSRARGTAKPASDYDLAVFLPAESESKWAAFYNEAIESPEILLPVDWVNASAASPQMLESIKREGVTIYEKEGKL